MVDIVAELNAIISALPFAGAQFRMYPSNTLRYTSSQLRGQLQTSHRLPCAHREL